MIKHDFRPRIIQASCALGHDENGTRIAEHLYVLDDGRVINRTWSDGDLTTSVWTADELLKNAAEDEADN